MKRIIMFLSTVFMLLLTNCSTFRVMPVDEGLGLKNKEGFFYSLPKTKIVVDVMVEKQNRIKGPYHNYAASYLGLKNVISRSTAYYKLSDVTIRTERIRDPRQVYFVELSKQKDNLLINLDEYGMLYGVNDGFVKDCDKQGMQWQSEPLDEQQELFNYFAETNLKEKIDTLIELINLDTITIEKKILKKTLVEKSIAQKAKEAADFIMRVKEDRYKLISGYAEVEYAPGSIEVMSQKMEEMEKDYITLFTGFTTSEMLRFSFEFTPDHAADTVVQLFTFSMKEGVSKAIGGTGAPVSLLLTPANDLRQVKRAIGRSEVNGKKQGFYYRMPEAAKAVVAGPEGVLAEGTVLVSQLGVVYFLPVSQKKISFLPKTGGLQRIGQQ